MNIVFVTFIHVFILLLYTYTSINNTKYCFAGFYILCEDYHIGLFFLFFAQNYFGFNSHYIMKF